MTKETKYRYKHETLTEDEFDDLYYLVYRKIGFINFCIKEEKEREKPNKERLLQYKVELRHFQMIKRKILIIY